MKLKSLLLTSLISLIMIASCSKDPLPEPPKPPAPEVAPELKYPAPENKEFRRIAYFPYYRDFNPSTVPDSFFANIGVACFAFAEITPTFTLKLLDAGKLQILSDRCKKLGVKILISFNGAHANFAAMVKTKENRTKFINSLKQIVDTYKLDGVDNDWEYPTLKDNSHIGNTYLMRELSNYLHDPAVNKLLTMAITSGKYVGNISNGIQEECYPCVDWFNIMAYDDFSTSTPGIHHSPLSMLTIAHNYWINVRNMPKSKFVSGIPCYGRASGITQSGTPLGYASIVSQGGDPDANEAQVTSSNYMNGTTKYTIYYNGRPLVREKTRFSVDNKLGGIFFWEAGQDLYDDRSLIKTAYLESIKN